MKRVRSAAPATALWILGLGVGALTLKDWIQLNDEGLMLQAASRISSGQLPYRDFWWFYPPGQPYLLALLWKLSGPSLVPWRVLRAVVDATVALLAWRLAGRRAGRAPALLAWAVAIFAVSSATGPHPYPIALMFALGCQNKRNVEDTRSQNSHPGELADGPSATTADKQSKHHAQAEIGRELDSPD